MKVLLENSFIIHSRSYGETSMIYQLLTRNKGLMSVLGKGIKSKKGYTNLKPFRELKVSYIPKERLSLMTNYEITNDYKNIKNSSYLAGIYFNELIYKFIPHHEPLQNIFSLYKDQMIYMAETTDSIDLIFFNFEVLFLKEIGYEITFGNINKNLINNNKNYFYDYEFGFKEVKQNIDSKNSITGKDLICYLKNNFNSIKNIKTFRIIIKNIFRRLNGGTKIKSYDLF
ncbi:MAG: DNA repair protein RecO [Gammaproteobacteria bacterium]|nr:DNA repair protein RecO [Gammaproteobacteria bacterium]